MLWERISYKQRPDRVMEGFQVIMGKGSYITNHRDHWSAEHYDPQYFLNLVKRVVRVSLETVRIVKGLPALDERK